MKIRIHFLSLLLTAVLLLAGCGGPAAADERLQVVATTSIVADVVTQVGGEHVRVVTLLPAGTDPHTFEPRPRDAAVLADARLVFANGAGLEEFLAPLLENAGVSDRLVEVSDGIALLGWDQAGGGEEEQHEGEEHDHHGADPHTWMDPNLVILWTENIAAALSAADPAHAADYRANADAYIAELRALDAWIREQVASLPPERRALVSDHAVFGYFAARYGFTQVGTITGSFSTNAAPSARELAALEDDIRRFGVPAVFVGATVNPSLAERVAADTGARLVQIYHASLTGPDGPAPTYLDLMRYNVNAIVSALRP